MSSISLLLLAVHDNVHVSSMKLNYSEPKIYTGGANVGQWSKLSKKEQKEALAKEWYVYFRFRDAETGILKRQPNIKAGANRFHNKRDRYNFLKTLQRNLILLLEAGFNPYEDNTERLEKFFGKKVVNSFDSGNTTKTTSSDNRIVYEITKTAPTDNRNVDGITKTGRGRTIGENESSIKNNNGQSIGKKANKGKNTPTTLVKTDSNTSIGSDSLPQGDTPAAPEKPQSSTPATTQIRQGSTPAAPEIPQGSTPAMPTTPEYTQYPTLDASEIRQGSIPDAFEKGLKIKKNVLNENSYPKYKSHITRFQKWLTAKGVEYIAEVNRTLVIEYLNSVLEKSSARNRNNARSTISSLFTVLEQNDIIKENFVLKINVLKTNPERNKTFTPEQLENIDSYLDVHDPLLKLFTQFISYNMLRPIEVCRLRVRDLDLQDRKLYVRAKNKSVKIKIIPDILFSEIPDLSHCDAAHYLFTPEKIGGVWEVGETDRRNYFSTRFKKVKDHFKLGTDYGLYSYRHTFITKIYRELAKTLSPLEVKSKLMVITGHTTETALDKYLRDIDAVLPEDYSHLLKNQ